VEAKCDKEKQNTTIGFKKYMFHRLFNKNGSINITNNECKRSCFKKKCKFKILGLTKSQLTNKMFNELDASKI
jgi:hypothetical protein